MAYSIIEKSPDTDLFFINPSTGIITLKKVWPNTDKTDYRVSIFSLAYLLLGYTSSNVVFTDTLMNHRNSENISVYEIVQKLAIINLS